MYGIYQFLSNILFLLVQYVTVDTSEYCVAGNFDGGNILTDSDFKYLTENILMDGLVFSCKGHNALKN